MKKLSPAQIQALFKFKHLKTLATQFIGRTTVYALHDRGLINNAFNDLTQKGEDVLYNLHSYPANIKRMFTL